METTSPARYHVAAITLHWVMAAAFLLMLASGLAFGYAPLDNQSKFTLMQWHKSLGVLLLVAFFLRVAVRILFTPPALPTSFQSWERQAAQVGHIALYVVMLAMPLSGWVMVSASPYGLPTYVFGLFEWPHIPLIAQNTSINSVARDAHTLIAYTFIALILVHVGAVIKHARVDRLNLLPRMGIGKRQP